MQYDENQKSGEEPQASFRKAQCLAPALYHLCSMPRRLGKVLREKSTARDHFKGLTDNESLLPNMSDLAGLGHGIHYPWFKKRKHELNRGNMCPG